MKKQFFVTVAALSIGLISHAQNFSGHFTIQSKEMVNGKEYLNVIAKEITVEQTKDSIKIIRVTPAGGDKTTTSNETLSVDGKPFTTATASKRTKIASIKLDKAKKTATIVSTFSYPDKPGEIEFKNTEVWTLNEDGTLTIVKTSDASVTDDWTIKAVFKK